MTPEDILEALEALHDHIRQLEKPPHGDLVEMRDWIKDMLEEVDDHLLDAAKNIREFNDGAYVECFGILYMVKGICPDTAPLQYKLERVLFDEESTAHPILMLPFRDGSGFIPADTGAYGSIGNYSWVCDEHWGWVWKRFH